MKKNKKNKFKPRNSVAKRFKITKSGKVMRRTGQHRHLSSQSSNRSDRRSKVPKQMIGKMAKKIKKMLGQ